MSSTKRGEIFFNCLSKPTFYIDIIAALPAELIFLMLDRGMHPRMLKLFYLNRLMKFYRVFKYFENMNHDTIIKLNLKQNLKFFGYFLLLMYGIICVHAYYYETSLEELNDGQYFLIEISRTLSLLTGVNFNRIKLDVSISWLGIVFQVVFFVFYNYIFSMIAAGTCMYMKQYQRFHEIMYHSVSATKILDAHIQLRVKLHFELHSMYRQGLYLLDQNDCFSAMTEEMKVFCKQIIYSSSLREAAFLKHLPSSLFVEIYPICSLVVMPAGEIVYYANETATEIYIIAIGCCESTNGRNEIKHYKSGDSLNVVPCFMETTSIDTVGTQTAVKCIVLPYDKLKNVLNRYDRNIIKLIKECMANGPQLDSVRIEAVSHLQQAVVKNHTVIINKPNKYYYKGFPPHLRFLKSFLLLVTFPPDGKFALYWEMSRSIITLLHILLSTIPTVLSYKLSVEIIVIMICDLFSIADLYFQHHICYYNRLSLLVYHPYSTAKHYWKRGLCLDLVSILPIDWIYILATKRNASLLTATIIRMNRYLQFIRVYKFTNYILLRHPYYSKYILIIRWLIIAIYVIQISAYLFFMMTCNFHWHGDVHSIICPEKSIVQIVLKWEDHIKYYPHFISLIGFHLMSLIFCTLNVHAATPVLPWNILVMECMAFIGLLMYIAVLVNFIAHGIFSQSSLILYQTRMKNLVNFMSGRVGKTVQKEIIDYYEYIWKKTGGNNLKETMQIFNTSLKMDSLYNVYGRILKHSGIFRNATKPFIKSFMMHISHEYYRNRGTICMVNNIHGVIYIVFRGTVDVLGPDFNRLLTLCPGSLFGNLDNVPLVRQTLTIVANGHVEVLSIPSVTFYDVLSKYPVYLKQFKRLTMLHVDYIETLNIDLIPLNISTSTLSKVSKQSKLDQAHNYFTRIRRRNKFVKIWDPIIINVAYFLSVNINSFCMITTTNNIFVIFFVYIFDILAIFNMYLKFHTIIRDDFGFLVLNRMKISATYRKSFFGFYFELMATVPFELLTLFFVKHEYFFLMYHLTRCNRLLRLPLVFKVTLQAKQKLNVNVYVIRILSSLLWLNALFCISSIVMALVILPAHGIVCDHNSFSTECQYFVTAILDVVKINNGFRVDFEILKDVKWYTLLTTSALVLLQRFIIDVIFLSQICATMQILGSNITKYRKYVAWLERFLHIEYVSLPLQRRILQYARLLWLYQNGVQFPSLLKEAPYYIREAVLNSIYGFHLREHYVFKDCHVDFLRQVAASIKCTHYFREDVICFVGDVDECLYIIHEGKVAALDQDSLYQENVHSILGSGEMFGIKQALFSKTGHDYTYKALEYTVILTLQKREFMHLTAFFPASRFVIYKALEETKTTK